MIGLLTGETMLKRIIIDINKLNNGDSIDVFLQNTSYFVSIGTGSFENQDRFREYADETFLITDNREAANKAALFNVGIAVYTNGENSPADFSEALYCIESICDMSDRNLERMFLRAKNLPWTILTTDRCAVREITENDIDRLYEIYSDEDATRYIEGLYKDRDEEIAYTRDYIKNQYRFYEYGMWIVLDKATGEIIGRAGIFDRANQDTLELGFMFAKEFWGKGIATEVLKAIMEYGKEELGINSIYAHVVHENDKSRHLLEKLSFKYINNVIVEEKSYDRYEADLTGY